MKNSTKHGPQGRPIFDGQIVGWVETPADRRRRRVFGEFVVLVVKTVVVGTIIWVFGWLAGIWGHGA